MRHAVALGLIVLTPTLASAGFEGWSTGHETASPVWVLPLSVAPANMEWTRPHMPGDVRTARFQSAEKCAECHVAIYNQWKGSMMANAWRDPIFQQVYQWYLQKSKKPDEQAETAMCSRCHTPAGYVGNESGRYRADGLSTAAGEGVSCDVCHSVAVSAGIGNAPFIFSPGEPDASKAGRKYGPRRDSVSTWHGSHYSELHTRSEMCGMCHDMSHARNNLAIESTYTEWRQSAYNTGDPAATIHCQDCHMRDDTAPSPAMRADLVDLPGTAVELGGKRREHVWQHNFVGGNLATTALLGHAPKAALAAERLKRAAKLELLELKGAPIWASLYTLKVRVSNTGAGHYLPTGLTFIREMWLDVKVTDAAGNVIYRSGDLDTQGNIRQGAVIYKTILSDGGKEQRPTLFLPAATQVLSDKRIRPKGHSVETFNFILRDRVETPLTAEVKLLYRSAPQGLVNELMGEKAPVLPVYEMAAVKGVIPGER